MMALPFRVSRIRSLALSVPAILGLSALSLGTAEPQTSPVEHGRYLVHEVAMCVQCHSPRDASGTLLESKLFHGGPIPFDSPFPTEWAFRAPVIAGLPGYSDEDAIRLLTTGYTKNGSPAKGPMPPFRMSRKDAEAVVAYLRTRS